ncbi:hypothetical protein Tco_1462921 [Tanacetum coccineum]
MLPASDSDWHGNVEFTRMILDYAAFWLSPRHSSLLPVLFLLKTPLASFTTTLTAIPSDFLGDSPVTCRWGYLSLATCRWGMIAGERSLGIRSPATRLLSVLSDAGVLGPAVARVGNTLPTPRMCPRCLPLLAKRLISSSV